MIYESAILAHADLDDEKVARIKSIVSEVVTANQGEILVDEDWGVRTLAQPTERNVRKGHYLYFMYKSGPNANLEMDRRFRISEDVIRSLIVQLGEDRHQPDFMKSHKNPFAS
jgi:small subunit ribosomal protein S6